MGRDPSLWAPSSGCSVQEDRARGHASTAAVLPVMDPRQPLRGGGASYGASLHLGARPHVGEADGHCNRSAPPDRGMKAGEVLPVVAALRATGPHRHCRAAQDVFWITVCLCEAVAKAGLPQLTGQELGTYFEGVERGKLAGSLPFRL